jgi:hypothetical protein
MGGTMYKESYDKALRMCPHINEVLKESKQWFVMQSHFYGPSIQIPVGLQDSRYTVKIRQR